MKKEKGFSLTELVIAILIIFYFLPEGFININNCNNKNKETKEEVKETKEQHYNDVWDN